MALSNGDCNNSIIKFLTKENDERGVGSGFLYKDDYVITCTHVLEETLDNSKTIEIGQLFDIQFPILDSSPHQKASLINYYPVYNEAKANEIEDIAILKLIGNPPESAVYYDLKIVDDAKDAEVRTLGFAKNNGSKQLVHVSNAKIAGLNGQQYYQIKEDPKDPNIELGFSGAPILDKNDGKVLGMLVYRIKNNNKELPYAIPSRQIKQAIKSSVGCRKTKTTKVILQFTEISPDTTTILSSILSQLVNRTNFSDLEILDDQYFKLGEFGSAEDTLSFLTDFRYEFLYSDWRALGILHAPKVRIYLLDTNDFNTRDDSNLVSSTIEFPMSPRFEVLSDFELKPKLSTGFKSKQHDKYPIKNGFENEIKLSYYCLWDQNDDDAISKGKVLPLWDKQRYQREDALYRFAYLWLILDQLPIGSWGRSLPQWMANVWKDLPKFFSSPVMEDEGGFETTILNLSTLAQLQGEEVLVNAYYDSAIKYLKARVVHGGFGTMNSSRHGFYIDPQPRHTALAVWLLGIALNSYTVKNTNLQKLFDDGVKYLFADTQDNIESFTNDRNPFLFYLVTWQIVKFIDGKLNLTSINIDDEIKKNVSIFWKKVNKKLLNKALSDSYFPEPSFNEKKDPVTILDIIVPYGNFLRMETYSLLTATMFIHNDMPKEILHRVRGGITYLLEDYLKNYGSTLQRYLDDPLQVEVRGLKPYYSFPEHHNHPDIGCNALMLQILRNEKICNILWPEKKNKKYKKARYLLTEDLVDLFDRALISPELYKLTNAGMLATILVGDSDSIKEKLTNEVFQYCNRNRDSTLTKNNFDKILSEESIQNMVGRLISKDSDGNKIQLATYSISRFLLANLKPGRYTKINQSDKQLQENLSKKTLEVYNTYEFSEKFYLTWKDEVDVTIVSPFIELLKKKFPTEKIKILDVGCGVGLYAKYFIKQNIHTDILDGSESNIAFANDLIEESCNIENQSFVIDITNNDERNTTYSTATYHGIWCSGLFAHLLSDQQIDILNWFNKILLKDGVLFVNAMIDNPRLFATDGRFYSYMGSPDNFNTSLKNTNFTVQQTLAKTISKNTHQEPYIETSWANFFATKTSPDTESSDAELAIKLTSIAYQKSYDEFIDVHANKNRNTAREQFIEFTLNELHKRVKNSLGIEGSLRTLDAGCGPGDVTHAMANRHWNVTGVDISDNMIRYARKYRNDDNKKYLNYEIGDLRHLPEDWKDQFDAVITITVFHHIPVYESAIMNTLINIARVLKKGGIFRFDAQLNRSSGFDPDLRYIQGYTNIDEILEKIDFESAGFKAVDKQKDVIIDKLPMYRNGYKREIALEFATFWLTKA